jgi:hypothetical protein
LEKADSRYVTADAAILFPIALNILTNKSRRVWNKKAEGAVWMGARQQVIQGGFHGP